MPDPKLNESLNDRFLHHPPLTNEVRDTHEQIRAIFGGDAQALDRMLPESREKAITFTKLEEAMFWANAAVARNQKKP